MGNRASMRKEPKIEIQPRTARWIRARMKCELFVIQAVNFFARRGDYERGLIHRFSQIHTD